MIAGAPLTPPPPTPLCPSTLLKRMNQDTGCRLPLPWINYIEPCMVEHRELHARPYGRARYTTMEYRGTCF